MHLAAAERSSGWDLRTNDPVRNALSAPAILCCAESSFTSYNNLVEPDTDCLRSPPGKWWPRASAAEGAPWLAGPPLRAGFEFRLICLAALILSAKPTLKSVLSALHC